MMQNPVARRSRWILARVKTHDEVRCRIRIEDLGYRTLLPTYTRKIRHARKEEWVTRALFPSYLFVNVYDDQALRPILMSPGVIEILSSADGVPRYVPSAVILDMQDRIAAGPLVVNEEKRRPVFTPGQRVPIYTGAFQGHEGLYVGDAKDRIQLLLEILGAQRIIEVPDSDVAAQSV